MQYLDESGNVLYEVNDSDKIFKMVNGKISGLAGTGSRMVVADVSGNLSAGGGWSFEYNEVSIPTSTATTIKTFTAEDSISEIFIHIEGYNISQCMIHAYIYIDSIGNSSLGVIKSASTLSLSLSGLNLQATQAIGSNQTVKFRIRTVK